MGRKNANRNKNSFEEQILQIFKKNPYTPYNYKQVSKQLNISDNASKGLVKILLTELTQKKELDAIDRGKYKLHTSLLKTEKQTEQYVEGIIDMKQTGKAYVKVEGFDEDVFIAANNTGKAFHKDTVKVFIFPKRRDRKTEGQIVGIIERHKNTFVGIIEKSTQFAFLIPDSQHIPIDIFIPLEALNGAKQGDKAIAEITDWPAQAKNPFGKIIQVLGRPGENDVEMNAILAEYEFPLSFPEKVIAEAEQINFDISSDEIYKRRDFRAITTFTIDPFDAKDFDDALSIQHLPNGHWEVGVHIADVSHYVKPNTLLDKEGFDRATSVYLVDRVIPMLPEHLSNGVCSLRPQEEKLCFSAVFELNENATVEKEWYGKTVIYSDKRFTYEEVQEIIEGKESPFKTDIDTLDKLAKKLREKRFNNGSINFRSTEVKFDLDEHGKPIGVRIKEQKDAHRLIEDFMLLANRKVAEKIGKTVNNQVPKTYVYRVHNNPSDEKLFAFNAFISKLGYKINLKSRKTVATSFNELMDDVVGKGEQNLIESLAIRTMEKAYYTTKNIGHYGLSFDFYTHFTSPIRRYPDILSHRLLEKYLHNEPSVMEHIYEEKCKHCSEMEAKAAQAERDSVKYKQVEFLMDKIGKQFNGQISGVSKWGIFVEIEGNKCEGMVSLKSMTNDYFSLDDENHCVIGHRSGKRYRLGDKVQVIIKKADLSKKQLDFEFVD